LADFGKPNGDLAVILTFFLTREYSFAICGGNKKRRKRYAAVWPIILLFFTLSAFFYSWGVIDR